MSSTGNHMTIMRMQKRNTSNDDIMAIQVNDVILHHNDITK